MEKKNTILLTVIAVATLLVAVVGATFAYYSITPTLTSGTTTYTANTGKIGSVAQTLTTTNLALKVTPNDMVQIPENGTKEFWAKNTTVSALGSENYSDSEAYYDIVTVTLSNGDEKTNYTCKGTINVKKGGNDTMVEVAKEGDLKLYLKTNDGSTIGSTEDPTETNVELDLSTLKSQSTGQTYYVIYKVHGTENTNVSTVKAALKLVNRNAEQQDLAGKNLEVEITTPTFDCDIDPASD